MTRTGNRAGEGMATAGMIIGIVDVVSWLALLLIGAMFCAWFG